MIQKRQKGFTKEQSWKHTLPDIHNYYKATVIKMLYLYKDKQNNKLNKNRI